MLNNKSFLAIIPARAGSKRLPKKNLLLLCGKPMIEWTIKAACDSKYIDEVVVSSDDQNIISIASKLGVIAQKRPEYLATDESDISDVIIYVIKSLKKKYDFLILLQPTSPLRTSLQVDQAIEEVFKKNAKAIVSLSPAEHSPLWSNLLPENGSIYKFLEKDVQDKRSQELSTYFRLNGAIYISEIESYVMYKTFMSEFSYSFIMQVENSVDVDTIHDFIFAEALLTYKNNTKSIDREKFQIIE